MGCHIYVAINLLQEDPGTELKTLELHFDCCCNYPAEVNVHQNARENMQVREALSWKQTTKRIQSRLIAVITFFNFFAFLLCFLLFLLFLLALSLRLLFCCFSIVTLPFLR